MINIPVLCILYLAVTTAHAAPAFILYDADSNQVILENNADDIKSVASLTKLMTAMVAIDSGKVDRRMLERLLIRSDNHAATQIAASYPGGQSSFIQAMNAKAKNLGLSETTFQDSHGISALNRSTAREYIKVVLEADSYPLIREISATAEIDIRVKKKKNRYRTVTLYNTNSLLREYHEIVLSKTGFTRVAGRCLALMVEKDSKRHVIVILGEPTPYLRAIIARHLIEVSNKEVIHASLYH